jgi:hypothetical protein
MPLHEWIAFNSPLARPWHFTGLELVVLAGFALTLHHALGRYRDGDRYPLFQWLVILAYGILLELIAFNFYQNYEHAQFTVQLYHQKLPLYIPAVYLVFHYTGLKLIERLGCGVLVEALLVGLAICLLDVPFDITGVQAGWWSWSPTDPRLAYRWLGVPVTSYYWYLTFGAIFAALCRLLRPRIASRPLAAYCLLAPIVAAAVIVLGTVAFLPFHALVALGVPDGAIVAAHLAVCAALLIFTPSGAAAPWQISATATLLYAWHLGLLGWFWVHDRAAHPLLEFALFALAASAALRWLPAVPLPRRRGAQPAS